MLKEYELNAEDERIIDELDNLCGVVQNKEVLKNMIIYKKLRNKGKVDFGNFNIIVRDDSSYNLLDGLLKVASKIFYKYNIIPNDRICYLDKLVNNRKDSPFEKIAVVEDGIIVINDRKLRINYIDNLEAIERIMKIYNDKVFVFEDTNWCEGETDAELGFLASWRMTIEKISLEDKIMYCRNIFDKNNLKYKRQDIKEFSDQPFWKIKNEVMQLIVECKSKDIKMVSNDMLKKKSGKTSVARVIGKLFDEENILPGNGEFVEIHGRDLVAKYVGWTAQKVHDTVEKAIGGVLFIDEAYSLVSSTRGGFEDEAIATLIKEMEDHRDEICIILAGYTNEMKELIKLNPGFESRIQFTIDFPDYSANELMQIFMGLCKKEKYKLSSNCEEVLIKNFEKARMQEDFGNGRYVRNVFEKNKI